MLHRDTLRDLLVADLVVEGGLATPDDVAGLITSSWRQRDAGMNGGRLLDALVASARLAPADLERLSASADRWIREAAGAPGAAPSRRHGGAEASPPALASSAPDATEDPAATGAVARPTLRPMDVDRYTDLTLVGEGGMGTVFRAHDADLDRPVALKFVRGDVAGAERRHLTVGDVVVARFLREARLTGRLEHPGIVPVHEVGRTDAGLPYYAMRLVRDSTTLAHAIEAAWDLAARLPLLEPFLKVCDTVAYAHGQGVIHRDLKPQNVALGAYGEVVVLDWGLAKEVGTSGVADRPFGAAAVVAPKTGAAHGRASSGEAFLTEGGVLGTVGYLAPEALTPDEAGTGPASDVFGLGVILFQILTGELPWPFADLYRYAVALQADAPAPSSIEPAVPEGLGAIAMRALARDRAARYPTAGELATALRSWQTATALSREQEARAKEAATALAQAESLHGEPALRQIERLHVVLGPLLAARPDHAQGLELVKAAERVRARALSERDQASRRRTRRRTGAAALVVLTAGAVAFAAVIQQRNRELKEATDGARAAEAQEAIAKRRAQGERDEAEQVLEFLLYPLRDALGPAGQTGLLLDTARKAVAYYEKLPAASLSTDSADRYHAALSNLGHVLDDIGDSAGARAAFERALAIAVRMRADAPTDMRALTRWTLSERDLANVEQEQRDLPAALARDERLLAILRARSEAAPGEVTLRRSLAEVECDRAGRLVLVGRSAEAAERYRAALAIYRALAAEKPLDTFDSAVPWTLVELANALVAQRDDRGALVQLSEARLRYEARVRAAPRDLVRKASLAGCLERMSKVHHRRKELELALSASERALALRREAAERDPANSARQSAYVESAIYCSEVLEDSGDAEEATRLATEALAIQERLVRLRPDHYGHRVIRGMAEHRLGRALRRQFRMKEALVHAQAAYELVSSLPKGARERNEYGLMLADEVADVGELVAIYPDVTEEVRRLSVSTDAIVRAKEAAFRGDIVVALRNWIVAMRVAAVRHDLDAGNAYRAAIVAARTAAALEPGADREAREALAMTWLEDDLVRRRAAANAPGTPDEVAPRRRAWEAHAADVRAGEAFLAPLRARADFGRRIEAALENDGR